MEEVVVVMEAMVLIAKMEGSLSALFHARFTSKRLLIMGIGCGLSFNVGINFIWSNGQILAINEIFEKNPTKIKNYGIWLRYQSRIGYHNMYKEYRDTTLNGIIKTATILAKLCKRDSTKQFHNSKIKFPFVFKKVRPAYQETEDHLQGIKA
ncbi:hypothetical protein CXB51_030527 [Gossypium anomalum]|uniref:Uncharacterized protein n=1 Tax=Gossypium anomalum TaxID=47600 RepID=A0A8J5YCM5_9ROSI|nr:hypothetical protein CXB51_030527 [Gossypium anomalum]